MSSPGPGQRPLAPKPSLWPEWPSASRARNARTLTPIACNECRARKVKCDGAKPVCSMCAERKQPCTYRAPGQLEIFKRRNQELQQTSESLHHVLELLKTAPEDTALAVFRSLREGNTPVSEIIDLVGSKKLPLQPSLTQVARATSLQTASTLEFDINVHFPNAFPSLAPLEVADIDLHLLGASSKRRHKRQRLLYDDLGRYAKSRSSGLSRDRIPLLSPGSPRNEPGQYVDVRLRDLDISCWTDVPIHSTLAARAIAFYLVNEHPLLAAFDADLFIRDLVRGEGDFCSPLLVSSVLAWSCATYSQVDPQAKQLSKAMFEEAERRWRRYGRVDSVINVSAAILLTLTCNHHGKDLDGVLYLNASAGMGRRLHLFDSSDMSASPLQLDSSEMERSASCTAWGAFGWHSLHSLYWRQPHRIHKPPLLPIPGSFTGNAPTAAPLPNDMLEIFTWISKFWLVIHDIFARGYTEYSKSTLSEAEIAFQKMLAWSEDLPETAQRGPSCPRHALIMHIWYHTAIMDIWRPFLEASRYSSLKSFPSADACPLAAYTASVRQLGRLLYQYRERFEEASRTMLVTPGFLYMLNEVFRNSDSREAQFNFIVSIRGCLAIAPWCPGLQGTTKALFSLGSREGVFDRPGWSQDLVEDIQAATAELNQEVAYSSAYPIDLDSGSPDIEEGNMEVLANQFEQLNAHGGASRGSVEKINKIRSQAATSEPKVWRGDPRDLSLTLSEATEAEPNN